MKARQQERRSTYPEILDEYFSISDSIGLK